MRLFALATSIVFALSLIPAPVADGTAQSCASPVGTYSACEGICSCGTVTQGPEVFTNSVTNECGQTTSAIISGNTVTAWGMQATLSADGTQLIWPNGSIWVRTCAPSCGDGIVQTGEECDDGNTQDNDGCSAGCRCELAGSGETELKFRSPKKRPADGAILEGGSKMSDVGEVIQVVYRHGGIPTRSDHLEYQYFKRAGAAPIVVGRCDFVDGKNEASYDGPSSNGSGGVLYFTLLRWVTIDGVCDDPQPDGSPPNGKVDEMEYIYVPCRAEKTTVHKQGDYPSECKPDILGHKCFKGNCKLIGPKGELLVVFTPVNTVNGFVCLP